MKEKEWLETNHCIWFCRLAGLVCRQFRHVDEHAVGWHWWGEACVTPRTPLDSSCSLSEAGGEIEWKKVEEQYSNRH